MELLRLDLLPMTRVWLSWMREPLVIRTTMRELRVMAVDAMRVDTIMLFRNVWTAKTAFLKSCIHI